MEIILSDDQRDALDRIKTWYGSPWPTPRLEYSSPSPTLTLGGYAGTGKTTLLGQLGATFPRTRIRFASYTGKAVSVLQGKLPIGSDVSTLHQLLYRPQPRTVCKVSGEDCKAGSWCATHLDIRETGSNEPCETVKKLDWSNLAFPLDGIDLVVVDEASMVNEKIWQDLTKWGVPALAVGDHGQLPPIKSEFSLMANPQIRLETILRQAEDSPIIQMATLARRNGLIPIRDYGQGCVKIRRTNMHKYEIDPDAGDLIIVGYNRTRNDLNESMRAQLGRKGAPQTGDIVICLRNSYENGIFNGMRGRIKEIELRNDDTAFAVIDMFDAGFDFAGEIYTPQFGAPKTQNECGRWLSLFDYGYAMTCHKAQGSQADRVMVIEERLPNTDMRRWLYTAVTRAAKELIVVGN